MKKRTLFLIIGGVIVFACLVCLGLIWIVGSSPTIKATTTAQAVARATEAAKPSDTPGPTATPAPTKTPAPTATPVPPTATKVPPSPTPVPIGMGRDNPVPVDQSVLCEDNLEVTVLKVEHGQQAWNKIYGYNMFNSKPDTGMEYILITVRVKFVGDSSKTRRVASSYFRVVGDKGAIYEEPFAVVLGKDLASELFGGGVTEGELAFQVGQGEKGLVLIYAGGGQKARYLSLGQ